MCLFFLLTGLPCFQTQTDIKELLETLGQNVVTKKRKNVEILWIAGTVSSIVIVTFCPWKGRQFYNINKISLLQ